jgi:hypothetical protein
LPAGDDVVHCRVAAPTLGELRRLVDELGGDSGCRPAARRTSAGYETTVCASWSRVDEVRAAVAQRGSAGAVTEIENLTEQSEARRAEVGDADRYAERGAVPRGLGTKERR